ncbi:MAG: ABC transporter substrate-binding protein [Beijerinckiaceae bacterium]
MTTRRTFMGLGLAGAAGLITAPPRVFAQQKLQDVTYLLPAPGSLPAFAPWMIALQRGYFRDEGLNVTFQVARGGVDVAKMVGAGNAVVGGAIGDTPILVRANGIPVRSIAVLGGRSLMQLVVNKDKQINSLVDLKGKTITTIAYQDTTYFALLGMLGTVGLTKNDVNAQAVGPVNVWKLFASGQADAMASVPDWTYYAKDAAPQMNTQVIPSDTVFKSMAQAIVASDDTIAKNPELLRKLVRATLRGLKAVMDDPVSAAADYAKAVPEHAGKEAKVVEVMRGYNTYVYPGQKRLGEMDEARLAGLQDFYLKEGIISRKAPLSELYTNQFIG